MVENEIEEMFRKRAHAIMRNGTDIGWGFGEALVDCYYDYLDYDDEELTEE